MNFFRFDTGKVFADYTPSDPPRTSNYQQTFLGNQSTNVPAAGLANRFNTKQVCFLYENPRFINESICFTNTKRSYREQSDWWPKSVSENVKVKAPYKTDTVSRIDYKNMSNKPKPCTRYGSNKNKDRSAKGVLPTSSETSIIAREKISYEHQFDCRKGRRERGKLHGSLVWEPVLQKDLKAQIITRMKQDETRFIKNEVFH